MHLFSLVQARSHRANTRLHLVHARTHRVRCTSVCFACLRYTSCDVRSCVLCAWVAGRGRRRQRVMRRITWCC
jgi:hypothetical protein